MYVCVYVYMYIYAYMCACAHIGTHGYRYACGVPPLGCPLIIYFRNIIISPALYVRIHSYTHVLVYVYLCACMHPYILMPVIFVHIWGYI